MDWQPCGIPDLPSPAHRRTASAALSSRARTARELPAQEFIEALLHWSIAAASGSPSGPGAFVTAGQLALLAEELALPETAAGPFGLEDLTDFFTENLNLEISGEPGGPTPATLDGTAVPMPPFLNWVSPQAGECDFATHNKVGPLYSAGAAARAARFSPLYPAAPAAPAEQPPDVPADYESLAAHLFRDWCLMIAKTVVQAAADAMAAWPVEITARTSLADVAAQFPSAVIDYSVRAGDTLEAIAARFGLPTRPPCSPTRRAPSPPTPGCCDPAPCSTRRRRTGPGTAPRSSPPLSTSRTTTPRPTSRTPPGTPRPCSTSTHG